MIFYIYWIKQTCARRGVHRPPVGLSVDPPVRWALDQIVGQLDLDIEEIQKMTAYL